jgi:hypothetical protein
MTPWTPTHPARRATVLTLVAVLTTGSALACGGSGGSTDPDPDPAGPLSISVLAGQDQAGLTGVPLRDSIWVRVTDRNGSPQPDVAVTWQALVGGSQVEGSARTDAQGRARAWWVPRATPGPDSARVRIADGEVVFRATLAHGAPATVYRGRRDYVDYEPGTLPLVISAPHGGTMTPSEMADRTSGTTIRDLNTDMLADEVADAIEARLGQRPHLIVARIHRQKVDLNREILEAAQGDALAEQAWYEFQAMIEHASERVEATHGPGFYVDLHGHGHDIQRLELGYLLSPNDLALSDAELAQDVHRNSSSIRVLAVDAADFLELVRGPTSLGSRFEALGMPAVPSQSQPGPGDDPYFQGGYNTARHGSRDGGLISGFQIEAHRSVRDNTAGRAALAAAIAQVLESVLVERYGWSGGQQ